MSKAGVNGPLFVSIGDAEKLNTFLELNPRIPRELALVDDYSFKAYNAAGLGKIGDDSKAAQEALASGLPPPNGVDWWKYATNVMKISPVPKDLPFGQIPEGVTRLGATFVVDGNDIKYVWADRIPGDHPDLSKVLEAAL